MTFTLDPETQKITFGVVSDLTNDAISIPLADQFGVSELFRDRFIYASQTLADVAWVPNDSAKMRANIGTEVLDFNAVLDSTVDSIVHDIGGTINNTAWVLRFSVEFTTLVESLSNVLFIGISDSNQTTGSGSAQDGLWLGLQHTVLFHRVGSMDTDASLPASASFDNFTDYALSTGVKYYVEIKRTASNSYAIGLFSDPEYTVSIVSATGTCPVGVTGLRYIKIMNQSTVTQTGNFQGTIDDVQFWNGVTVPTITTNHWRIRFKLDITNLNDGGNSIDKRLYIGLFDEEATSGADNIQDGFLLLLTHDNTDNLFIVRSPNGEQPRLATDDATFATAPSESVFYVEIKRDSLINGSISLYPDDTYTTPTETESITSLSGSIGFRYLKLMNDVGFTGAGAIDGTFDDFEFNDLANVDDMGLVTYWKFEETTLDYINNSEALASGGSSWDITPLGLVRGVSSIVPCQGFAVEGTGIGSAMVPLDTSTSLGSFITDKTGDWSINIWQKSDDNGFFWLLNSANSSGSNTGLEITLSSGFITPRVRNFSSGNGEVYKCGGGNNSGFSFLNMYPLDFLWHMITFGYKASTNQVWSSVDGSAKLYESNTGTAVGFTTSNNAVRILNRISTPISSALDGKLDEYSIWRRELTDTEISTLYNSGSAHGIYGDSCVPIPASSVTVFVDAVLVTISATWQFREWSRYGASFNPTFTFLSEVTSPNRMEVHTGGSFPNEYGVGLFFKVFRISDITGSDISVTVQESPSSNTLATLVIEDGAFDAISQSDIPNDTLSRAIKGAGIIGSLIIDSSTETTFTLSAGSINYAGSTEGFVTVFISFDDANAGNTASLLIRDVEVSEIATWEFISPTVSQYLSGTFQDYGYVNATTVLSRPEKIFTIDGLPFAPPAILFLIDAKLIIPSVFTEFFTIDGLPFALPVELFLIDARLVAPGDFGQFRDIGDLILRVLTENPLGLTGDAITDKIREITEVELVWGFLGKKHRVKGWLNRLYKDGVVQNDGSDPDWWQSVWTLV